MDNLKQNVENIWEWKGIVANKKNMHRHMCELEHSTNWTHYGRDEKQHIILCNLLSNIDILTYDIMIHIILHKIVSFIANSFDTAKCEFSIMWILQIDMLDMDNEK